MSLGRKYLELGCCALNARPPTEAASFLSLPEIDFAARELACSLHGRDAGFGRLMVL
jgi:hypothetical protein